MNFYKKAGLNLIHVVFGLCCLLVIESCEDSTRTKTKSKPRPSDGQEGDLPYLIEETLNPAEARTIQGKKTTITFEANSVSSPVVVRLERMNIEDVPDEDAVQLGSIRSEIVKITVVDAANGELLSSNDLLKSYAFMQELDAVQNSDDVKLLSITNPGESDQSTAVITDVAIEAGLGLASSDQILNIKGSFRATSAIFFAVEIPDSETVTITKKTSSQVNSTTTSTSSSGQPDAGSIISYANKAQLVAGNFHTCFKNAEGKVKCWGGNADGQTGLGLDSTQSMHLAYIGDASGEMNFVDFIDFGDQITALQIASHPLANRTCALLSNQEVICWGKDDSGSLGTGRGSRIGSSPGDLANPLNYIDFGTGRSARLLAVGSNHNCAILDNHSIKCWGANGFGQLGIGSTDNKGTAAVQMGDNLPVVDLGLTGGEIVKDLALGVAHSCALTSLGRVKCWGGATDGNSGGNGNPLGYPDSDDRGKSAVSMGSNLDFVELKSGRTVRAISAGNNVTCAILDNDEVNCWGWGATGALGLFGQKYWIDGDTTIGIGGVLGDDLKLASALNLGTDDRVLSISTNGVVTCVLKYNDQLKCFGGVAGLAGQTTGVGTPNGIWDAGTTPTIETAVDINFGTGRSVKQLALGGTHACAYLDNGTIKCWGDSAGPLGSNGVLSGVVGDSESEMGDALPAVPL